MTNVEHRPGQLGRFLQTLVLFLAAFLIIQLITLYLSWPKQLILGCISVLIGIATNKLSSSRLVTLALMFISLTATLRYAWWRTALLIDFFADESNNRLSIDSVFMLVLISAEAYTILIMVLGYMQTAWPLRRVPIPMPNDETLWPHVDVLIPTYNEPLSLVRYTTLAANNIDYSPEKLHVYILDDGSRTEFKEFAQAAGVGYVTRIEHNHAKAGNINHALTQMNSSYVTIFDCDHVPTRSFLQMTLGWMLADPNLAMLQTPHHFYSPDPFERNLLQYKTIPNEAELFYGIVQDGNDFWNATFFCGSCALIRRSALDSVGGIATETVTEDAHTSLRMQKRGYNTAYINIPQAAGLATETLAAHVGQRIRWARGMIQIFRTDNPLLARGMKFTQRLCYLNAMIHFLYAVPRLVFLGAPLVYMLIGRTIIPGYWVAILAYAIPHLILSSLTNSRIQGRHRHSFWNEIYEAVLAPYILAPTLLALINPKFGKFNVTDKGSTLSSTRFDRKIATPTRWMLAINFVGVLVAPYRMFVTDTQHPGTVIMNLVWILFNIVILGVAAAVAHEQKQRRSSVRIDVRIPMRIHVPGYGLIDAVSIDMSVGGTSFELTEASRFSLGDILRVSFPEQSGNEQIGASVVGVARDRVRLAFSVPTIAEQETLTRALYSRADAWINPTQVKEVDRPLVSLGRVIVLSWYGLYQICRSFFPERPPQAKSRTAEGVAAITLVLLVGWSSNALCGTPPVQKGQRTALQTAPLLNHRFLDRESPLSLKGNLDLAVQLIGFKDLGLSQPIELRGPDPAYSINFILAHALVPRHATLKLVYSIDPIADSSDSRLTVSLNGTQINVVRGKSAPYGTPSQQTRHEEVIELPSDLLVRSNNLAFEFNGSGIMQNEAQVRSAVLCEIYLDSVLEVSGERLPWHNDLSNLPLPLLDSEIQTPTTIPVVFLSPSSSTLLEAAGIVASWLGLQSGSRPARFSIYAGEIPAGNAIIFSADRSLLPSSLQIQDGSGPLVAMRTNPTDPSGTVLVIAGGDEQQTLVAARTLSLTKKATDTTHAEGVALIGDTVQFSTVQPPSSRVKGDAPRWMPTSKTALLNDCHEHQSLVSDGSTPLPVYLHLPPDLFYGERQTLKLHLFYRYNSLQAGKGSALRVFVNGNIVSEVGLPPGTDFVDHERLVLVPVASLRPFGNTFLFNFDFVPANRPAPPDSESANLKGQIGCNSSLDLQGLNSWVRMPSLELFADAGFPFTQLADLSQTIVVLPVRPSLAETSLFLNLMSHFGAQTGYPALQVKVEDQYAVIDKAHDYLILGTIANQPAISSMDASLPVTFDLSGVHVKDTGRSLHSLSSFDPASSRWWSALMRKPFKDSLPSNTADPIDALVEEIESPVAANRSIVLIALKDAGSSDVFTSVLFDRSHSGDLTGSVSLLRNAKFESYVVGDDFYHVGDVSSYSRMRIWLSQNFVLLLIAVMSLSFVIARWTRNWLQTQAHERLKLAECDDRSA